MHLDPRTHRLSRAAAPLMCLALLMTGCDRSGGSEAPSASAPTTVAPTVGSGVLEFEAGGAPLAPGTYRNSDFNPPFTFSLGAGWEGGHDAYDEFFDVINGDTTVGFAHPTFVGGKDGERVEIEGMAPREVLRTIASNPSLQVRRLPPASIGGQPAPALELTSRREGVALFGGAAGDYGANPDHRYRISALQVDGVTMLVVAIATGEPVNDAFRKAETVITTITT